MTLSPTLTDSNTDLLSNAYHMLAKTYRVAMQTDDKLSLDDDADLYARKWNAYRTQFLTSDYLATIQDIAVQRTKAHMYFADEVNNTAEADVEFARQFKNEVKTLSRDTVALLMLENEQDTLPHDSRLAKQITANGDVTRWVNMAHTYLHACQSDIDSERSNTEVDYDGLVIKPTFLPDQNMVATVAQAATLKL